MEELPEFPHGLVALVATVDATGPHVIPVSALHRAGPRRALLALAHRRGTLARLRARPAVALSLAGPGFVLTAHGRAAVVADPLPGAEFMAGVEVVVERLVDHLRPETRIHQGIDWAFVDDAAVERHRLVVAALQALPQGRGGTGPHLH
jgi:hypothetical protein